MRSERARRGNQYLIESMLKVFRPYGLLAAQIIAWILATAIVLLSLVSANLRPETGVPHGLEHFLAYSSAGAAFGLGYGRNLVLVAVLLFIFTGTIEITQLFLPGRHARLSDFVVDALAMEAGLITVALVTRIRARFAVRSDESSRPTRT